MKDIRRFISVTVVGLWAASMFLILILMIFRMVTVDEGKDIFKSFSSVTSGFVGIVIGYYFTRSTADEHAEQVRAGDK